MSPPFIEACPLVPKALETALKADRRDPILVVDCTVPGKLPGRISPKEVVQDPILNARQTLGDLRGCGRVDRNGQKPHDRMEGKLS